MNLLNAVAIGDIQKLREDTTGYRNKKKIKSLLEARRLNISRQCQFKAFGQKPSTQIGDKSNKLLKWMLTKLQDKGYFSTVFPQCGENDTQNQVRFIRQSTYNEIKEIIC